MIEQLQNTDASTRRDTVFNETMDAPHRIYNISNPLDENDLRELLLQKPYIVIQDSIQAHLRELMKISSPSEKLSGSQLDHKAAEYLNGREPASYGVWVYYPWLEKLVHLPDKEDFIALRTNRNIYKITPAEQTALATKKVGVIGLSVGQSVALTLAMERSFGELRIADFDSLEISNMNRIRTGVQNLGLPKTVLVAREIAEIDPFLNITRFDMGISQDNIDRFLHENGKLDVLIDECDSLDIKILARKKARAAQIPVLMDTSDRGMIDIERYDTEPERALFHGMIGQTIPENAFLDPSQRVQLSLQIAGAANISNRMKNSLPEIGKTISTWPQLASSVVLGGGAIAELTRKLLLNETVPSGRFYIDLDEIIKEN